jgi:hypothetical protein
MDSIKKHLEKLQSQIDNKLGEGKADEILAGLDYVTGKETPQEAAEWARAVVERLENQIDGEALIEIREECACIKANKYSAYNKKYFKELRAQHPEDDEAYLKVVVDFLNVHNRCGRYIEYIDGKIISHFSFGEACVCTTIKGGWAAPPSSTWCRCCQGSLKSIYNYVFPDKVCRIDIVETFATGGNDCVFVTWYTEK